MGDLVEFPLDEPTLLDLANTLEEATDKYALDINKEAERHNAFLRKYHLALLEFRRAEKKIAATLMPKASEGEAVDELCQWNLALARRDASRAKCRELEARLSAHQTHAKFVAGQS